MEYKLLVRDRSSLWRATKEVRLSGVDTILKPSPVDDNYTFLMKDKKVIYIIPALNVISIELINNEKENEDE